jgi:hypothetical protein
MCRAGTVSNGSTHKRMGRGFGSSPILLSFGGRVDSFRFPYARISADTIESHLVRIF